MGAFERSHAVLRAQMERRFGAVGSTLPHSGVGEKIVLRVLIYFIQFVLRTWPQPSEQSDSRREMLRTSAAMRNMALGGRAGPATASPLSPSRPGLSPAVFHLSGALGLSSTLWHQMQPHYGMLAGTLSWGWQAHSSPSTKAMSLRTSSEAGPLGWDQGWGMGQGLPSGTEEKV